MAKLLEIIPPKSEISWIQKLKEKGMEIFQKIGLPQPKTEIWKYTKPRDLFVDDFTTEVPKDVQTFQSDFALPAYQFEFLNGKLEKEPINLPKGLKVRNILEAKEEIGNLINLKKYPFAALNTAFLENGLFIQIEKNIVLDKPIVFINKTSAGESNFFYNLRNLIVVGENASAEFLEHYIYEGIEKSRYFANIVSEIHLEKNAILHHYKLQ